MKNKYMKCPNWVNWREISRQITAKKRKKEFMGRLKHGKRFRRTSNPGPH